MGFAHHTEEIPVEESSFVGTDIEPRSGDHKETDMATSSVVDVADVEDAGGEH